MANWNENTCSEDSLIRRLSSRFATLECEALGVFPDLRQDTGLAMASDYSGEHEGSPFQVLTFLLADRPSILQWDGERLRIRQEHLADGRRLSFKGLSDALKQKAVIPFLKASANMNGIVLCMAVEKSLADSSLGYPFPGLADVKPLVLAKLVKIALFGSFLVGGLSSPRQNLRWITDEDEVVSNVRTQAAAGIVLDSLLGRCCSHRLGSVFLGIAGKFEDGRRAEDLCAIPDLVGGAIAEVLASLHGSIPESTSLLTLLPTHLSTKTELIFGWLATLRSRLTCLLCVVRPAGNDEVRFSFAIPFLRPGREIVRRRLWRPPDKGWLQSTGNQ